MRPRRPPATGLPDHLVEQIVIGVIARHGSLVVDVAVSEIRAEQRLLRLGRKRRLRLVPSPSSMTISYAPTGAA